MMRNRSFLLPLAAAWLMIYFLADISRGADPTDADQMRLRTSLLPTDPAGLVQFFRLRAQGEPSREKLSRLIEALHSPMPSARQQACAELVAIGKPALPLLRGAANDADARSVALVRRCLKAIETDGGTLTVAAARLLAQRRPPGTAGALLDYLPHAENQAVLYELQEALNAAAYDEKGVPDPAVVKALSDESPLRRATVISALAQGDLSPYQDQLRKLLRDSAPSVRLRAALALAQATDPDAQAVSTLITLLGELADLEACETIEDFLSELAGELGPKVRLGSGAATRRKARDAWATWWRSTEESTGLLDELKKRTTSNADLDKIRTLIQKLGDDRFPVRQKAQADLIRLGGAALPLLKLALKDPDPEVRWRARDSVASIEMAKDEFLLLRLPVIARLIALRKPSGAAEAILAYLPSLDDDGLIEELQYALNAVAFSDGKPSAALLKGLTDKSGVRRAAAAEALCVGRRADHLKTIRKLLNDAEPSVRLKVTLALAGAGDRATVSSLISMVAELPTEQSQRAEAYLNQLARVSGPPNQLDGEENKKKRSKIWSTWWEVNQSKVALIDSSSATRERFALMRGGSLRGYTLVVQQRTNTVTELDPDGKPRWTLTGLLQPCDAQVLAGGQRVLVAEQNRVTERDLRGKVLWQKEVPQPCNVQRLRNGNIFIPCQNHLIEVDRAGREVLRVALRCGIVAARKLPDGRIVAFDRSSVIQLDKTGRESKRVSVRCGGCGCNEVLDNGHVLALSPGNGNIIEFDLDGKQVGRFDVQGANHGFRLSNGHTLLTLEGGLCMELDKKWKPIKQTPLQPPPLRVKRR